LSPSGAAEGEGEEVGRAWGGGEGLIEVAVVRRVAAVEGEVLGAFGGGEAVVGAQDEAGVAAVARGDSGPTGHGECAADVLGGGEGGEFEGAVEEGEPEDGGDEQERENARLSEDVVHGGARCGMSWSALQRVLIPKFGEAFR
jgi:hypothetical protein